MSNLIKKFKLIIGIVIGIILVSGVSVYATVTYLYNASDVKYSNEKSVEDALNELYNRNNINLTYNMGANSKTSGIETINITKDCSNAMIISGQGSLEYSINSNSSFTAVNTAIGTIASGRSTYYAQISVEKGDTIYIKRNTNDPYGWILVY